MSNEPATQETTSLDRMEQFHASMRQRAADEGNNAQEIREAISAHNADQIFSAAENPNATAEDILNAGASGAVQGRDAVGLEVRINGFRVDESTRQDLEGTNGYYVTCDSVVLGGPEETLRKLGLDVGDEFALQTGADGIIFKLRALEMRGMLPVDVLIWGITTQAGNTVLRLKPVPRRVAQGAHAAS